MGRTTHHRWAAAVANAIHATGVRLQDLPMTPESGCGGLYNRAKAHMALWRWLLQFMLLQEQDCKICHDSRKGVEGFTTVKITARK
ncbi:MAG: hypothetical protein R2880_03110 [Deinococcales bacterium]